MNDARAIAVVGGGVVGLSCALNLRRAGASVTVFDEGAGTAPASAGNAGHIAAEQVQPLASPSVLRSALGRLFVLGGALDFRLRDVDVWAPWALDYLRASTPERFAAGRTALASLLREAVPAWRRLTSSIGEPNLVKETGHLVVWESTRTARSGMTSWPKADVGTARFETLDESGLAELAGHLKTPLAGGLRFCGTGQVGDPTRLLGALRGWLARNGVRFELDRASAIPIVDGRASLRLEKQGAVSPDLIVVAAGVGSGALMRSAGHRAPVIAERGYHIEGPIGDWPDLPPVVFEDRSIVATRFGDRLRVTSFVEFGRAQAPPDGRKWRRLHRHARELGLPIRQPFSQWMGSRPTLPDYLPAIGVSSRATNLIYAFGHQHLGLTLAPVTGEIVGQLAGDGPSVVDAAPFDLRRFGKG